MLQVGWLTTIQHMPNQEDKCRCNQTVSPSPNLASSKTGPADLSWVKAFRL